VPLWVLILVLAGSALAQHPQPSSVPPHTAPSASTPGGSGRKPLTNVRPARRLSNSEVQRQIEEKLRSEPDLADAKLGVKTNDNSVTLKGTVVTDRQHHLAFRIAESYAGDRKIVDEIKTARPS
jgi:BON domain